ncbi:MAG TPA: EamA family transporter [Gaiellaceae bacterium]|jgi:drug/metabolite transporter (DMT)-like permease|nr:EamA family transporter [Gaiellaceae bacterium]
MLLAGARDSQAFAAVVLLVGAVVGAPVAALYWRLDDGVWPFLAATSALELAYFALLAFAYTRAELSVVYPLARGLAPVLVLAGAVAFTEVGTTSRQVVGVLTVAAGIVLVRGVGRGRGALLAVTIACAIASYTVVDKHGVVHASPVAYLELMSVVVGVAYTGWIVARRGVAPLRAELGWRSVAAGIGTFAAYACVLGALQLASAASVAAVRESGVLVATALAAIVLRESVTKWRAAGAVLVVAGIVLLSI